MTAQMPTDPVASLATLLGAGGVGAILLKIIERMFARADKGDEVAAGLRGEMVRRLESLEKQLASVESRERELYRRATKLESENRQLRRRYHELVGWMAAQPEMPTPPKWLYEHIDGPTAGDTAP